jgi:hypothetical protein
MGRLANRMRRDLRKLLTGQRAGNRADVTVVWNTANLAAADPNLEATYPTAMMQSGTWPALVHFIQPAVTGLRQFAEIEIGDAIVDFSHEAEIPANARGATFYIAGDARTFVQKQVGKDLAEAWDLIVEGQRVMKTFLITEQSGA